MPVTSMQQATAIQKRRVEAGKKGHAHAVRRFFRKESINSHTGKMDWYAYNELKQSVPYIDPFPLEEETE